MHFDEKIHWEATEPPATVKANVALTASSSYLFKYNIQLVNVLYNALPP